MLRSSPIGRALPRFIVLLILALGGVARAQSAADMARDHYQAGLKYFDAQRYGEAVDEFQAAYELKADPAFLYNIAQCHRLAGHTEEAIRYYRTFLALVPATPVRPRVEGYIAELEASRPPEKTPEQGQPDKPEQGQPGPQTSATNQEREPEAAPKRSLTARLRPYVPALALFGASIGLAAFGLGFGLGAQAEANHVEQAGTIANPTPYGSVADSASRGRAYETTSFVFWGLASATAVAGTVLAVLASRHMLERPSNNSGSITLLPSFASDGKMAAAGLVGRW